MEKAAIAVAALAPCLVMLAVIVSRLRRLQPPISYWHLAFCFLLSLLSIAFVGLWTWGVEHWKLWFANQLAFGFYESFLLAAIPEELSRYLILRWRLAKLTRPVDLPVCMLLGCLVGLVFGTIEHVAFSLGEGWHSCWQRLLLNVPYHTFAGAIIAYFIGYALRKQNELWGFVGVAMTTLLHGINNFNLRRFFETIDETGLVEHTPGWLEEILVTHWPSNIFVTVITSTIAMVLFRRAKRIEQMPANSSQ